MNNIQTPQNNNDLKKLYNQFGGLLTPQNRQLLGSLISELDKGQGSSRQALQNIATQLQKNAQVAQNQMQNEQKAQSQAQNGPMSRQQRPPQNQQWPGRR